MCKQKQKIDIVPIKKNSKKKKILKFLFVAATVHVAIKAAAAWQKKNLEKESQGNDGNSIKTYHTLLSGRNIKIEDKEFKGTVLNNILGGISLDLSKAIIKEDAFINCRNMLGGVDIRVPAGVNVHVDEKGIMSGISNMVPEYESDVPTIYVESNSIMGGISIRMVPVTDKITRDELMENDILEEYADDMMGNSEKKDNDGEMLTEEGLKPVQDSNL